jgi:hypothetical protein
MQNEKSIRKDVNILDLFNGLSRKQAKSLQECALGEKLTTVYDLVVIVANKLAGRAVIVSPKESPYKGQSGRSITGAAYKNARGVPVIHIPPGADEYSFNVFLHELAHVKLHADIFPTLDDPQPGRILITERDTGHTNREAQADDLAGRWLKTAKKHSCEFPGSEFVSLLLAINLYGGD